MVRSEISNQGRYNEPTPRRIKPTLRSLLLIYLKSRKAIAVVAENQISGLPNAVIADEHVSLSQPIRP
jgi:hypothetical protein